MVPSSFRQAVTRSFRCGVPERSGVGRHEEERFGRVPLPRLVKGGRSTSLAGPMIAQEAAVSNTPEIGRPFASDSSRSEGSALHVDLARQ
jgi:hypothetical protein